MNPNVAGYNRIRLVCKTFQLLLWMQLIQQYMVLERGSTQQTKVSNGAAWASPSGFCKASDAAPGRVPLQVRGHDLRSVSVTKNGSTSTKTYYYDESGNISKILKSDGSYTRFHYDSDNLEYEERYNSSGNLTALFKYFYDSDDKVSYVLYKHSQFGSTTAYYDLYHYVYNGLGEITDIVKVQSQYDYNINPVQTPVAHYEYDPYGQIIEVTTSNNDNFGKINPIRYKGYYYDTDLDWYHLSSRYYDPSICRFISPDDLELLTESPEDITDKNLYAYCDNNPIMRADNGGKIWFAAPLAVAASYEAVVTFSTIIFGAGVMVYKGAKYLKSFVPKAKSYFAKTKAVIKSSNKIKKNTKKYTQPKRKGAERRQKTNQRQRNMKPKKVKHKNLEKNIVGGLKATKVFVVNLGGDMMKNKVHYYPLESTNQVSVMVIFPGSLLIESRYNNGITHFLEHLHFRGGHQMSQRELYTRMELLAASFCGHTTNQSMCFSFSCCEAVFRNAFDLFCKFLFDVDWTQGEFMKEKLVVLREEEEADRSFNLRLKRFLFGNCSYSFPIIGRPSTIKKLTTPMVRDWYSRIENRNNFTILISGKIHEISRAEIDECIRKALMDKGGKSIGILPDFRLPERRFQLVAPRWSDESEIVVALFFPKSECSYYEFEIFWSALCSGDGAIILRDLRETYGFCTEISDAIYFHKDYFILTLSCIVKRENVSKSLELIGDALEYMRNNFSRRDFGQAIAPFKLNFVRFQNDPMSFNELVLDLYEATGEVCTSLSEIQEGFASLTYERFVQMLYKVLVAKNISMFIETYRKSDVKHLQERLNWE